MSFQAAAQSQIFIGTKAPDAIADAYVKVGGLANIGGFGFEYDSRRLEPMGGSLARHIKTSRALSSGGAISLTFLFDAFDAGQTALVAALLDDGAGTVDSAAYNVKITLNDRPQTGTDPNPTTIYFRAVVTSGVLHIGGPTDIAKRAFELQIDSEITLIPASA